MAIVVSLSGVYRVLINHGGLAIGVDAATKKRLRQKMWATLLSVQGKLPEDVFCARDRHVIRAGQTKGSDRGFARSNLIR